MVVGTVAVLLLSTLQYALWNALLKDDPDKGSVRWTFGMSTAGWALFHGLVTGNDLFALSAIWPLAALSLLGQTICGSGLVPSIAMATYRATIRSSLLMVVVSMLFLGAEYELLVLAGVGFVLLGAFLIQYCPGMRLLDSPKTLAFWGVALCSTGALARWRLRCEHYASAGGFVLGRDLPNNGLHGQVSPIQTRQS